MQKENDNKNNDYFWEYILENGYIFIFSDEKYLNGYSINFPETYSKKDN